MANMAQAIRMALHYAETNLEVTDIFGQDVGAPLGGVFTATQGLKNSWNAPLDERGIIGAAMGIAMAGDRCVAEIQFCDYIFNTIDLLKIAGNTLWCTGGQMSLPMVVMTPVGAGIRGSVYHSHSFDSWATRLQGWKVVMPSTPLDAYGLLLSAVIDPNPVLFLKPKALMRVRGKELIPGEPADESDLKARIDAPLGDRTKWKPRWPALKEYLVPIGTGQIVVGALDAATSGSRSSANSNAAGATIVTYGRHVHICQTAIQKVVAQFADRRAGIGQIELIDMRSLFPYDWSLISESIRRTGRVLFVNEDTDMTNFGEHLAYRINREMYYELQAAPRVLAAKNVPGIGLHPHLEENTVPQENDVIRELVELLSEVP